MTFRLEKIGESAKIRKIAVTGPLAAGKSTLLTLLKERGAYIVKSDEVVHNLLSSDPISIRQITEAFGSSVLTEGSIDRNLLAKKVFIDREQLKKLEAILHPKVIASIKKTYQTIENSPAYKAFVVEIPLLFEISFDSWFDEIIYVKSDKARCKERYIQKGHTEDDFEKRWACFSPSSEAKADRIIENNGSLEHLNHTQPIL